MARHEFAVTLRERAGWGGIVVACALVFADSALRPLHPIVSGLRASDLGAAIVLPFIAIIMVAGAARRDQATRATEVVQARPWRSDLLFLSRVLGNVAVVYVGYALVIASSLAAPLAFAGRWPSPLIALHAFARGVVPLFFITTLTYCAVAIARNVLAAALVAVYALFVFLWGDYLARVFNYALTQNWTTYGLVGVGVLLGTMGWARRTEGASEEPWRLRLRPAVAVAMVLGGLGLGWHRVVTSHDKPLHADALALNMASQSTEACPRAPGFWLPDQHGANGRMSSLDGHVVVLLFWSPHRPESVAALEALREAARRLSSEEVAFAAVCLADDHAVSRHVAAEGRYPFMMVTDPGTHFSSQVSTCSPIAEAYSVGDVPEAFVTDRGRRITMQLSFMGAPVVDMIVAEARKALAVPAPPS